MLLLLFSYIIVFKNSTLPVLYIRQHFIFFFLKNHLWHWTSKLKCITNWKLVLWSGFIKSPVQTWTRSAKPECKLSHSSISLLLHVVFFIYLLVNCYYTLLTLFTNFFMISRFLTSNLANGQSSFIFQIYKLFQPYYFFFKLETVT